MAYPIPTPDERKRLFRLIQQHSSWTAWAYVGTYHKAFIDALRQAFEDTQQNPPANEGPLVKLSEMAAFLNGYASFEGALVRLRTGDKSVFKFLGYGTSAAPYFWEANRKVSTWVDGILGALFYTRGMDVPIDRHPLFPQIEVALKDLSATWARNGMVLQTRHTDLPAPIETSTDADPSGIDCYTNLDYSTIPAAADLPDVPAPTEEVLVKTGDNCPCYGIWEPVKAPLSKGFVGLFKQPLVPVGHVFELDGCMNYLHQGSPMPTIAFEGDAARGEGRPTIWRLLWKDERYLDGTLPAEEAQYRFFEPKSQPTPAQAPRDDGPSVLVCMSEEIVPESGVWACESNLHWRITVKRGDTFPIRADGWLVGWVHVPDV
jgi:hypothetical protein